MSDAICLSLELLTILGMFRWPLQLVLGSRGLRSREDCRMVRLQLMVLKRPLDVVLGQLLRCEPPNRARVLEESRIVVPLVHLRAPLILADLAVVGQLAVAEVA